MYTRAHTHTQDLCSCNGARNGSCSRFYKWYLKVVVSSEYNISALFSLAEWQYLFVMKYYLVYNLFHWIAEVDRDDKIKEEDARQSQHQVGNLSCLLLSHGITLFAESLEFIDTQICAINCRKFVNKVNNFMFFRI